MSPARTLSGFTRSSPTRSEGRRSWVRRGARERPRRLGQRGWAALRSWTGRDGRGGGSAPGPPLSVRLGLVSRLRTASGTARWAVGCFPRGVQRSQLSAFWRQWWGCRGRIEPGCAKPGHRVAEATERHRLCPAPACPHRAPGAAAAVGGSWRAGGRRLHRVYPGRGLGALLRARVPGALVVRGSKRACGSGLLENTSRSPLLVGDKVRSCIFALYTQRLTAHRSVVGREVHFCGGVWAILKIVFENN